MKKLVFVAAALALIVAAPQTAQAQATVSTAFSLTINNKLFIDVDLNSLTIPEPDIAEFDAGATQAVSHDVLHKGNVAHTITVAPTGAATTWTGPLGANKPISDLEWKVGAGTWQAVDNGATVGTGVKGGFGVPGNEDIAVSWRALIDYDDLDGVYSTDVTYTSTAN